MKRRIGWYVLAYDISDPKRLRKVHTYLKARGLPVQRSVFLIQTDLRQIRRWLNHLKKLIHAKKDDLRAYPVGDPTGIWMVGSKIEATFPPGKRSVKGKGKILGNLWKWVRRKS